MKEKLSEIEGDEEGNKADSSLGGINNDPAVQMVYGAKRKAYIESNNPGGKRGKEKEVSLKLKVTLACRFPPMLDRLSLCIRRKSQVPELLHQGSQIRQIPLMPLNSHSRNSNSKKKRLRKSRALPLSKFLSQKRHSKT